MRAVILALVLVGLQIVAVPRARAQACWTPPHLVEHSPLHDDLPLEGSIFLVQVGVPPPIRWVRGTGKFTLRIVGENTFRVDYVADGDAVLVIHTSWFNMSARALAPVTPTYATFRRTETYVADRASAAGFCMDAIRITVGPPVAALRTRVMRTNVVRWLVSDIGEFKLGTLDLDRILYLRDDDSIEVTAILRDGSEHSLGRVAVADIPREADARTPDNEPSVDPRAVFAVLFWFLGLGVLLRGAPLTAISGRSIRGYLPKLRFRIRMPRARVVRR